MVYSNLTLYGNVYPWKGRWREGDQEFVAKIWDEKALVSLNAATQKKEVVLTDYQKELLGHTVPCPRLPKGENPWGLVGEHKVICLCRKVKCPFFQECRPDCREISERERRIWSGGNQDGLDAFELTWQENRQAEETAPREIGEVDLQEIYGRNDYELIDKPKSSARDPNTASGYPDDEQYEPWGF